MSTAKDPKDLRIKQELLEAEKRAEQLNKYFQDQKPEWTVTHRWGGVFDHQIFYFVKGKEKHNLEVSRQVLTDLTSEKIAKRLRDDNWEQILQSSPSQVA